MDAIIPRLRPFLPLGIPRVDWTHPITLGLKGVWIPGAYQFNLATGAMLLQQGTANQLIAAGPYGPAFTNNNAAGTAAGFKTSDPPFLGKSGGGQISIFGFSRGATSGSVGAPLYGERAAAGNDIIKLGFSNNTVQTQFVVRNDAGTLVIVNSVFAGAPNDNLWHSWAATKNGNGGSGNLILYRDGVVEATGNWTGTDSYTDAGLIGAILFDPQDSSQGINSVAIAAVWTRVLNPVEIFSLNADPFCFLVSNNDDVWEIVGIPPPPPPLTLMPQILT